jgi:imidazolonepropionase-like amidohydrolase
MRATYFVLPFVQFAMLLASCSTPPQPGAPVLYEGARLITGGEVVEDSAFVVEKGEFKAVGKRGSVEASGATRVDLTGKTVIPALVDAHAHLGWTLLKENRTDTDTYSKENLTDHLRRYAYYGIAAVRNLASIPARRLTNLGQTWHRCSLAADAGRGIAMPNAGPGQAWPASGALRREQRSRKREPPCANLRPRKWTP